MSSDHLGIKIRDYKRKLQTNSRSKCRITVPAKINGLPVTQIDKYIFSSVRCNDIVLPDTIQNIGSIYFQDGTSWIRFSTAQSKQKLSDAV